MLRSLNTRDMSLVHKLQTELGSGDTVTSMRWRELEEHQQYLAQALGVDKEPPSVREPFKLIRDQVDVDPLVGPRWWFHLIGLRHGGVHVVLLTPQKWVIIQRRSWSKDDSPGALDIA